MNRSDNHIDVTLEIVRQAWKRDRNLSLCRLIGDVAAKEYDPYHVPDGILMERLVDKKVGGDPVEDES